MGHQANPVAGLSFVLEIRCSLSLFSLRCMNEPFCARGRPTSVAFSIHIFDAAKKHGERSYMGINWMCEGNCVCIGVDWKLCPRSVLTGGESVLEQ